MVEYIKFRKVVTMKQNKFWIIIFAVIFIISAIGSLAIFKFQGKGNIACIYQDGELIKQINLDTVTTPYQFTVNYGNSGYNTVSVENGRISVIDASCPDHVCINTGWISDGAIPIVCLPNKLTIQMDTETNSIDGSTQ